MSRLLQKIKIWERESGWASVCCVVHGEWNAFSTLPIIRLVAFVDKMMQALEGIDAC